MTDEQIKKALEICSDKLTISCPNDCPFYDECENDLCALERQALDLINRKDAEIERLNNELVSADEVIGFREAEIERLQEENKKQKMILEEINNEINPLPFVTDFDVAIKQVKSEAYKEFAERLKEQAYINNYCDLVVNEESIDNLLKELTEGSGCNGQDHEG